jgi:hypothetical protein
MVNKPGIINVRIAYKWIALSNTTLGVFMAFLDGSIVLISPNNTAIMNSVPENVSSTRKNTTPSWVWWAPMPHLSLCNNTVIDGWST